MNIKVSARVPKLTGILPPGGNGRINFGLFYSGEHCADDCFPGDTET